MTILFAASSRPVLRKVTATASKPRPKIRRDNPSWPLPLSKGYRPFLPLNKPLPLDKRIMVITAKRDGIADRYFDTQSKINAIKEQIHTFSTVQSSDTKAANLNRALVDRLSTFLPIQQIKLSRLKKYVTRFDKHLDRLEVIEAHVERLMKHPQYESFIRNSPAICRTLMPNLWSTYLSTREVLSMPAKLPDFLTNTRELPANIGGDPLYSGFANWLPPQFKQMYDTEMAKWK
jgi:hypothetical protein